MARIVSEKALKSQEQPRSRNSASASNRKDVIANQFRAATERSQK